MRDRVPQTVRRAPQRRHHRAGVPGGPQRGEADDGTAAEGQEPGEQDSGHHRPPRARGELLHEQAAVHGPAALGQHEHDRHGAVFAVQAVPAAPSREDHADGCAERHSESAQRDHHGAGPADRGTAVRVRAGPKPGRAGADAVPEKNGLHRQPRGVRDGAGRSKGLQVQRLEGGDIGVGGNRREAGDRGCAGNYAGAADLEEREGRSCGGRERTAGAGSPQGTGLCVPLRGGHPRGDVVSDPRRGEGIGPGEKSVPGVYPLCGPPRHRGTGQDDFYAGDDDEDAGGLCKPKGPVRARLSGGPGR
mmetsp:Transcript_19855/g.50033  ORF Transcript_19855/g.50033 Transcript_19855/m.50033 type:complete len:304 (-) Transcript_19855:668-1579(-)